jgi:hypothetical protein
MSNSSVVYTCLTCGTPLDPDDEVVGAIQQSFDHVGRKGDAHKESRYVHAGEEAQVVALGGWTLMDRGRLRDLTSRDVSESQDRL